MKLSLPQATAESARVGAMAVGQVKLGPARVGRLSIRGLQVDASATRAELSDVTLNLKLAFSLVWSVGWLIDVPDPWPDIDLREHGTLDLGSAELAVGLGHLELPGLKQLPITVASLSASDVQATIGALQGLRLGPAVAEQIRLRGVQLPSAGMALQGLGLGAAQLSGVSVPAASAQQVDIGRLATGATPIPSLSVKGLQVPPVRLDPLHLSVKRAQPQTLVTELAPASNDLLSVTLRMTTTASLDIKELSITGMKAGAQLDEIVLQDVALPAELLDVTLSQLGIGEIAVPTMELR